VQKQSAPCCAYTRTTVSIEERPGRRLVPWAIALATTITLALTLVVSASSGATFAVAGASGNEKPVVPQGLLDSASAQPNTTFRVVVQGARGTRSAGVGDAVSSVRTALPASAGRLGRKFSSIDGVAATLTGRQILRLAQWHGISAITPDTALRSSGYESAEMWRQTSGLQQLSQSSSAGPAPQAPTIAIIDSGIDATKTVDFGSRVVASVNFSSLSPGTTGDQEGHGTMVAGVAAGGSDPYPGAAPNANLVDVRTANGNGESLSSDVIAGIDWILAHRVQYGIRVVNLSMVGDTPTSFQSDPLDKAVEKLWFSGVVVVAAAGNTGTGMGQVDMSAAPGNDPFVITVGATDQAQTSATGDDYAAPWSSYGHTVDGFAKPELSAPGRYLVMPVPPESMLATALPNRAVAPGYMWMSGTSFAAPLVSGAAAQLLARHPDWTPDQVKGALMLTARFLAHPQGTGSLGTTAGYAVLAGTTVTSTGPTTLSGNLGLSPGTSVTGAPRLVDGGVEDIADPDALQAKANLVTAYNDAAGQVQATVVTGDALGGLTLSSGVYSGGALDLTGTLTLDAQGDPGAVFVFQAASTLVTASASEVRLINGASACNVFWKVGSSATLGTTTHFQGTILALTSIGLNTGATVDGRLLARNGAVTLDSNTVRAPECSSPLAGGVGQIDAAAAAGVTDPPNPNENLDAFVAVDPVTGQSTFDNPAWLSIVSAQAQWTSAQWTSAQWTSAQWTSAQWTSAQWTSAQWTSAQWTSAQWTSAVWTTAPWVE
jgi:subtilisin family serine protease